jgi:diguanylate cyclase (GGDEF)-like protein
LADSGRKLAASLKQVQQLASHDELTGTLNRRSLMAALERERSRAERSGAPFSIAMIDLDHFKRVNDTHGHAAGDEVLRALAATVHDTMRAADVFGRYGGEEFMMILDGAAPALALEAMERIRAAVAAKNWSSIAPDLSVTLSAGIASHRKGETIEQLLHRTDLALYQAKDAGRNTVIASPS